MRDIDDIDIGDDQVAVVKHNSFDRSPPSVRAVVENNDALQQFVNENFMRSQRPHVSVEIHGLRE